MTKIFIPIIGILHIFAMYITNHNMKTTRERLEDLFNMIDKKEVATEIDIILDDFASTIMVRLEREFTFEDAKGKFIAGSCYVSPPAVGEFITVGKMLYKVIRVTHCFESNASGTIILETV